MEIKIIIIIITITINTIKQEEVKNNKIISGISQRMIKLPLSDMAEFAPYYSGGMWGRGGNGKTMLVRHSSPSRTKY